MSERITPSTDNNPETRSDRGFDVFLNFRGPDSRHTVADVLYDKLTHAGFRVFLDDEEIWNGEVIEGELLRAITNSRVYIPIFSKDYASSKWCLRELAKMIDCWETSSSDTKKVILPVFYDVDVSKDIKLRSEVYTSALQRHKDELSEVVVTPWEAALRKVAGIKGWNLKDHGVIKLAELISKEVFCKLATGEAVPRVPDCLVGIDKPLEDIIELLEEGSPDVRFIVIHGMGGIGKTTLAKVVFKKISSRFQGSCFIKDVRRSSSEHDMVKLQEKLLSDTLNLKFIKVFDTDDGKNTICERLCDQNVLIILDDVDERDCLLKLAAKSYWFGPKTRIIITTRNINFLPSKDNKKYRFYEMKDMDRGHALQLFCWHAFENDRPPPEFHDIATKIVATTGGLPLSLKVIGSSLCYQDAESWKFTLKKLKEAPHKDVQQKLMISYEALEYEQQQIFLDIASLFNDKKKKDPIYFWEACGFFPANSINILVQRSLIKVDDHDTLWMHDQLRDLGRAIAQPKLLGKESQNTAKASRLCSPERALDALQKKEVAQSVVALNLGTLDVNCHLVSEEFAGAVNLRFLQLQGGNFEGDFKNVFQCLRWLSWFHCPLRFEATNLSFKNLVVLRLSGSHITKDWGEWRVFMDAKHLKVMHLEDCKCLKNTPDFSTLLRLERLILQGCLELEEIDGSINKLKQLNYLEINYTLWINGQYSPKALKQMHLLPDPMGNLKSLKELKIEGAGHTELHPSIGELVHLRLLHLRDTLLGTLPRSIGKLTSLVELDLSYSSIEVLPDSIGDLKQLKFLTLASTAIEYLPDTIGSLELLEWLSLYQSKIIHLPETIGNLKSLKAINVSRSHIQMLPKALVKLENLESLVASSCQQMDGKLPEDIGNLPRLSFLNLQGTAVSRVPTTMKHLSHLLKLDLKGIHELQTLSNLPTSLIILTVRSQSLESHKVPDLSYMINLVRLELVNDSSDYSHWTTPLNIQTPHMRWLERLSKLEGLTLRLPDLVSSPIELSSLSRLQCLTIRCFDPRSLKHLPSSLGILDLYDVKSPIDWQLLASLNNLSDLQLYNCWLKEIEIDRLEKLRGLWLYECKFLKRIPNLSLLKELSCLVIYDCTHLVEIEDLGELKSLERLWLNYCNSIKRLPNLSSLKKLEELCFHECESLESIPEVDEEEPCYFEIINCRHFRDFRGPYSEYHRTIKHECLVEGSLSD